PRSGACTRRCGRAGSRDLDTTPPAFDRCKPLVPRASCEDATDSFLRKQRQHRVPSHRVHKPVARSCAAPSVARMPVSALSIAPAKSPLSELFPPNDTFPRRHLGPDAAERAQMLEALGYASSDALVDAAVPKSIRLPRPLQ